MAASCGLRAEKRLFSRPLRKGNCVREGALSFLEMKNEGGDNEGG
jgi:hypothetical protein